MREKRRWTSTMLKYPITMRTHTLAFKKRYSNDVCRLEAAIVTNPFKLDKLTVLNQETASFNASVFENIKNMSQKGEHQFLEFWKCRLNDCTISIKEPITLNSFNLPGNQSKRAAKDPIMTKKMMGILVEAAKERRQKVENALTTELFGIAQSLAKDQYSLYHGTKSHVMNPFSTTSKPTFDKNKSGVVIELSMLFRKTKPTWVHTFSDFAKFLYNEIMKLAAPFS